MNLQSDAGAANWKKIFLVDLAKQWAGVKSISGLGPYIGGVGLGVKLFSMYADQDPVVFSVGPLNGYFPFVSKTSVVLKGHDGVEDIYVGGTLSFRIKFAGADAIVITGRSEFPTVLNILDEDVSFEPSDADTAGLGLPGKRSVLTTVGGRLLLDGYFAPPNDILEEKFAGKNLSAAVVTGTKTFQIKNTDKYEDLYKSLLAKSSEMSVEKGHNPSCSGCPMGCEKSKIGESGGSVLVHSLVACEYSSKIYGDAGTVFSCLNVLGYDYTHEDIENLPALVSQTLEEVS